MKTIDRRLSRMERELAGDAAAEYIAALSCLTNAELRGMLDIAKRLEGGEELAGDDMAFLDAASTRAQRTRCKNDT